MAGGDADALAAAGAASEAALDGAGERMDDGATPRRASLATDLRRLVAGVLMLLGALALLIVVGWAALSWVFSSGSRAAQSRADEFVRFTSQLPGVGTTSTRLGFADIMTSPTDVYASVRLRAGCDLASTRSIVDRIRAWIGHDHPIRVHPVVWCSRRGIGVSPDAGITATRFSVYEQLTRDPATDAAAIYAPQPSDDPQIDTDNEDVVLVLHVPRRANVATTAAAWVDRLGGRLPALAVTAAAGNSDTFTGLFDEGFGPSSVLKGQFWLTLALGEDDRGALLRTAAALDRDPHALGHLLTGGAEGRSRVAVLGGSKSGLLALSRDLTAVPEHAQLTVESH